MKMTQWSRSLPALIAAAALGCATGTTGPGSTGQAGPGGTTGGGGNFTCLSAAAKTTTTKIDCYAIPQTANANESGKILSNGATIPMAIGTVTQGKELAVTVAIKNTAPLATAAALGIASVRFEYTKGSASESDDDPALSCWDVAGTKRCADNDKGWKQVVPAGSALSPGQVLVEQFKIVYKRQDAADRQGKIVITFANVDPKGGNTVFNIDVKTVQGKAKLALAPADGLNFPYVQPSQEKVESFSALNSGDATLHCTAINLSEIDPAFQVKLTDPADFDGDWHQGSKPWTFGADKPLEIAPGASAGFSVKFTPKDDKKKSGSIKFVCNDPAAPALPILANAAVPCIGLSTSKVQFGGHMPGAQAGEASITITNCGGAELVVTSLEFVEGETKSNEFAIDQSPLGPKLAAPPPVTAQNPLKLPISGTAEFKVNYAPADITDPEKGVPDVAVIVVKSNAFKQPKVTLEGVGVEETCPVAKVTVTQGEQVVPQTTINLIGNKSYAPGGGTIKKYKWTVKQPAGSNKPIVPNAGFANPTFTADAAGTYTFCLEVWDQNDVKSCVQTCVDVLVIPNNALHIELLWNTPSDPDETDSGPAAGADLDLHFAHPLAATLDLDCDGKADPWFSNPWDTFWFNATPEWGAATSTKDNPTLDLDDTDGAGPENLNLIDPEGTVDDPVQYSVGVHYWHDHGYGTSYASMSIFIQGGLALQFTKVKLDPLDMWYVGLVNWPNTASGGGKKVFETCYQSGKSCPAKKNLMWQPKGDWCITKCYVNKAFVGTTASAAAGKCGP